MTKAVLFGKEARDKILEGVKKITDAVRVTMGASGKCVLIGDALYGNDGMVPLPTIITKDGYTVTKHFSLPDPVENRGAIIIKEAAAKTVEMAGDATTCTCVLAEEIIRQGVEMINDGANAQLLKKGIDSAVGEAIDLLKSMSIPVNDKEAILNVASVSANNDSAIGSLIADAFDRIGRDGIVDIMESKSGDTVLKFNDGYKFSKGWVTPFFVNKKGKEICELENPLILLYEKRINHHTQIQRSLEWAMKVGRPLLIICEDVQDEGLGTLVINNAQGRVRVCAVKSPYVGQARMDAMEDMAILTGGTYISDSKGVGIKEIEFENLGQANKVIITKESTVIVDGVKDQDRLTELLNDLKMNLTQAETEDEKYAIEKRIASLTGSVAVIHVGAATETEMKEKLDRFDDSVRATKAALQEGVVAGGGTAFVRIYEGINVTGKQLDYDKGRAVVLKALLKPLSQMAENAGADASMILDEVFSCSGNIGYNTLQSRFEDMVRAGIIDSTKALRCALLNAASVSGVFLTSECLIETTY